MPKLNKLTWLPTGLLLLLTACGGNTISQPAPVEAPQRQVVEEVAAEVVEPSVVEEAVVEAAPAVEDEMMEEETVAVEQVEAEKSISVDEAVVVEEAAMEEAMPAEEQMTEEKVEAMSGPSSEQLQILNQLNVLGQPPELNNEVWLNSEPLKLADLHGKVVLVEFWTFGCYNCKNVIPSLREWHNEYSDDGLVIIGVHTPEFGFEKEVTNVEQALVDLDVRYPVAIDNDWATWRAYKKPFGQRYWPTKYFVDKAGNVRYLHIGEGGYDKQEQIIQALLAENGV